MTTPPPPPPPVPEYLQEDDVSDECKNLLSTLPTTKGWVSNHLYQYQGFWVAARHVQGVIACQKHFRARETDIILVTNPKSGTTWLKAMAFALVNRSRFLDDHVHPLFTTSPHDLVPFLELKLYIHNELPDLSTFTSPRLFATHLPIKSLPRSVEESSCKLVYLCRNPKDTFASLWHFTNKLRPKERGTNSIEEVFEKFCKGESLFGPFWDHVLEYWNESLEKPHKVLFMRYEDVKKQPAYELKRLAEFLECPFSPDEENRGRVDEILRLCSFDNLSNLEVNKTGKLSSGEANNAYFRKGEVGDWAELLTSDMVERFDRITDQKMFGSEFKF